MRNDTNAVWQLRITFDGDVMTGALRTDKPAAFAYTVENGFVRYERRDGRVYQIASVRPAVHRTRGRTDDRGNAVRKRV